MKIIYIYIEIYIKLYIYIYRNQQVSLEYHTDFVFNGEAYFCRSARTKPTSSIVDVQYQLHRCKIRIRFRTYKIVIINPNQPYQLLIKIN